MQYYFDWDNMLSGQFESSFEIAEIMILEPYVFLLIISRR